MAQTQPVAARAPAQTAMSEAKQQKLEKLWKAYEQVYGMGMITVKGYRLKAKNDDFVAKLDDPQTQEKALAELGKAFGKKASETFTDAEIDYLIALFSSPVAKKLFQLEGQFWKPEVTSPYIRIVTNPAPAKPAPPQPKAAPAPRR